MIDLSARLRRPVRRRSPYVVADGVLSVELYHCVLMPDDITFADLAHALRHSGLCLSTDGASGCQTIHRRPTSPDAA